MLKAAAKRVSALLLSGALLVSSAAAADWPQFLGDPAAQGVSAGQSPTQGSDLALRWEKNTGSAWTDVPGTPIVVGDYVYYYSSQYLRKLELATGKEVDRVQVYGAPMNQFFINIAYGEGKIFLPCQKDTLDDGQEIKGCFLRVYDAQTLDQLYVTETISNGQLQSPVMYHDGYVVTGTYGRGSAYACFAAGDEDPARSNEVKKALWSVSPDSRYGFSFNGAAFVGDHCYFGCENILYVVNYKTGETRLVDIGAGLRIHSTIVYSAQTGRLYVSAAVTDSGAALLAYELGSDGMPDKTTALEWRSGTPGGGTQSSPVIYNGRLYLGGGGGTMGSAEPFHVLDAATLTEIYSVPILSKGSAGLSTAYATEENGGTVYIYMVPFAPDENGEAELWIISDRAGQTEASYEVVPLGRQYCSQSVLVAHDGSLIWYSDGGSLYCCENTAGLFDDTRSHWGKDYVAFLARRGMIDGIGNNRFAPNGIITRAQFVQILAKMSGEDFSAAASADFDDVKTGDWFAPAIGWAVQSGVIPEVGGSFRPNEAISRQDMALLLYRYADRVADAELAPTKEAISFTDAASITGEAAKAVETMQRSGIIDGMPDGDGVKFAPGEEATRAQAAAMLTRFYQALN